MKTLFNNEGKKVPVSTKIYDAIMLNFYKGDWSVMYDGNVYLAHDNYYPNANKQAK